MTADGGFPAGPPLAQPARRAVLAILAAATATALPLFMVSSLAVQLRQALHISLTGLGLVVAVYYLVAACCSVPSGRLCEHYGGALVLRAAGLACGVLMLSVAVLARSWWSLTALVACAGAPASAAQPAANLLLVELVPPGRQGTAFGVKQSAIPAAALCGGLAVPGLALTVGWRWAFALAGLAAAGTVWWLPRRRHPAGPASPAPRPRREPGGLLPLVVFATGFGFGLVAASALAGFLVSSGVVAGLAEGTAGLVAALAAATGLLVRLATGALADRHQRDLFRLIAGMLLVGCAGYAGMAVSSGGREAVLFASAAALAFGAGWGWNGLYNFAIVRARPDAPAWATGVTQTGGRLGSMAGPLVFGLAAGHVSFAAGWTVAAIAACAAAVAMLAGRRLLAARQPEPGSPGYAP